MQEKEEVIFAIIVVIFILIFLGIMFLVILARNNARKNRLLFENERIKKEYEETLLKSRLEIQEHTLNHVSREIHDNIGQLLSLARLELNSIGAEADRGTTDELLEMAIAELRSLSHSLNTNHIKEKGFTQSLEDLLNQFQKSGKFQAFLIQDEDPFQLAEDKELILFRVIQELLNNITKHAQASEIKIELRHQKHLQQIIVTDNGVGFDTHSKKSQGIGLKNISERVAVIGGNLTIFSEIGKGTRINISIPNEREHHQSGHSG